MSEQMGDMRGSAWLRYGAKLFRGELPFSLGPQEGVDQILRVRQARCGTVENDDVRKAYLGV